MNYDVTNVITWGIILVGCFFEPSTLFLWGIVLNKFLIVKGGLLAGKKCADLWDEYGYELC